MHYVGMGKKKKKVVLSGFPAKYVKYVYYKMPLYNLRYTNSGTFSAIILYWDMHPTEWSGSFKNQALIPNIFMSSGRHSR